MTTPIPVEQENELDAKVAEIIRWIAANTGYPVLPPPTIQFVTTVPLPSQSERSSTEPADASYNRYTKTVYLKNSWRLGNETDLASLAHELVHHLQFSSGGKIPCRRDAELEAHELAFAFGRQVLGGRGGWKPGGKERILTLPCN